MYAHERLFVALDVSSLSRAKAITDQLTGLGIGVKIGSQLFTAEGPAAVEEMLKHGFSVFLDLKFHDIPNTVAGAVFSAVNLGVQLLNVHCAGGLETMRAASETAKKTAATFNVPRPLVLGVTVLTSLDRQKLTLELNIGATPEEQVLFLAGHALSAGLDGVVASAQEITALRAKFGTNLCILTPALRPAGGETQDQVRVDTVGNAAKNGADYFVVGRPITEAPDPVAAAGKILAEITAGWAERR